MGTKTSEGASKSRFQGGFWAPWAALKMVEVLGKGKGAFSSAARELYREPAKTHTKKQQKKEKEKEQQKIRKT